LKTVSMPAEINETLRHVINCPCTLKDSVVRGCMEATMRKLICILLLATIAGTQVGCFVPIWSAQRDRRARQLIYQSESFRHIPDIWERIWGLDMPDVATPYRTHGGVI